MKAKAILLGAILATVTTATQAQTPVYSVNVVGYTKIVFPANQYKMISNQLQGTNTSIPVLFPSPPANTAVYKFNAVGTGYDRYQFVDGAWEGTPLSLAPGEGAFVLSPQAFTNIFSGDVVAVSTNTIPNGYSIRSSVLPQAGYLQSPDLQTADLGFPVGALDEINTFNSSTGTYNRSVFVDGAWEGAGGTNGPSVQVGESFFVRNVGSTKPWVRTFSVQ